MPILNRKSINSERNRLTVNSLFLKCICKGKTNYYCRVINILLQHCKNSFNSSLKIGLLYDVTKIRPLETNRLMRLYTGWLTLRQNKSSFRRNKFKTFFSACWKKKLHGTEIIFVRSVVCQERCVTLLLKIALLRANLPGPF